MPAPNMNQEFVKLENRHCIYSNPLRWQFKTSNLVVMAYITIFAGGQTLRISKWRRLFKLMKLVCTPPPTTHNLTVSVSSQGMSFFFFSVMLLYPEYEEYKGE